MTRETTQGHPADVHVPAAATMQKTREGVDEALLAEAGRLLGTGSESATVNLALAELIKERRRREAVEAELRRYQSGQFAGLGQSGGRP